MGQHATNEVSPPFLARRECAATLDNKNISLTFGFAAGYPVPWKSNFLAERRDSHWIPLACSAGTFGYTKPSYASDEST